MKHFTSSWKGIGREEFHGGGGAKKSSNDSKAIAGKRYQTPLEKKTAGRGSREKRI